MDLVCSPVDVPATIKEISAAIVVLGGFSLSTWLTIRQNRKMDTHQEELRTIASAAASTGTFKAIPPPSRDAN